MDVPILKNNGFDLIISHVEINFVAKGSMAKISGLANFKSPLMASNDLKKLST